MLMPPISRLMTPRPYALPPNATAARARDVMHEYGIRHLPIVDRGQLVGLVTGTDLEAINAAGVDLAAKPVTDVIGHPPIVWGRTLLDEAAEIMSHEKAECVVVVGAHGVEGIFTANDALRELAVLLHRFCG